MDNARDTEQIKAASRLTREAEKRRMADLRAVMSTVEGRRFLWTMLGECGVGQTIWHPSALIHYRAGRLDLGNKLQAEMITADADGYLLTQREAIELAKREGANFNQAQQGTTK